MAPEPISQLFRFSGSTPTLDEAKRKRWLAAPEPHAPITHVLERADGHLWVLSYSHLIESDARLRRFRRIHDFALHYAPGRPDAVGSYPAVISAVLDDDRLLLTTKNDGLVEYSEGQELDHALPEQIGDDTAFCVATPAGVLFLTHFGGSLRTNTGHWKNVEFQFTGLQDEPLSEPSEPITDPDVLAARKAVERWNAVGVFCGFGLHARIEWDAHADLLATTEGALCLLPHESSTCSPFSIPGITEAVTSFARDEVGRLWLAGRGLWRMSADGHAIPVRTQLPFMTDTIIREVLPVDGKLVLTLGDRGAAVVDPRTLATD